MQPAVVACFLALLLFIAGVALAAVSGAMETVEGKAEKHFGELREQYEQKDLTFCAVRGEDGAWLPMLEPACRAKIRDEIESNFAVIGTIAGATALFFGIVIFFTYHCVIAMRKIEYDYEDDEEDGGGGDGED
eukprot:SAG22_NODE_2339_length_2690_cov_2.159012_1_plen_133_part_00